MPYGFVLAVLKFVPEDNTIQTPQLHPQNSKLVRGHAWRQQSMKP